MSKSELTYNLKTEIRKINKLIDRKIIRGLSYAREARYHRNLLRRLSIVRRTSFLARLKTVTGMFA